MERSKRVSCCELRRFAKTLHQIGIKASSCQVCLSFKVLFKKNQNLKKKRKEKNLFEVNEDLGTNIFSQEEENDAK